MTLLEKKSETSDELYEQLCIHVSKVRNLTQPIFGFPELSHVNSDEYAVHAQWAHAIWEALSKQLGRPACVLDLRCSQGYLPLFLAQHGAPVVGIDQELENIALCQVLAQTGVSSRSKFVYAGIEEVFETGDLRHIDLVIGFGIFGNLLALHGAAKVASWMSGLAENVSCLFDVPNCDLDQHGAFSGFTFTHELAQVVMPSSEAMQTLLFASKRVWYLDGRCEQFTHATQKSHPTNEVQFGGTRRYFRNDTMLAKVFALRDYQQAANRDEISREVAFLSDPPNGFAPLPHVHTSGFSEREGWIVRDRLPGELLSEAIRLNKPYDPVSVVRAVLMQLVLLEAAGLYHNDLRTWNVLLLPDESATLIDYGSITTEPTNLVWPKSLFPAFWLFVWCVATRAPWYGDMYAPAFISPYNLPDPFQAWALTCWQSMPDTWTFALLADTFDDAMKSRESPILTADQMWRAETEMYMTQLNRTLFRLYSALTNANGEPAGDGF